MKSHIRFEYIRIGRFDSNKFECIRISNIFESKKRYSIRIDRIYLNKTVFEYIRFAYIQISCIYSRIDRIYVIYANICDIRIYIRKNRIDLFDLFDLFDFYEYIFVKIDQITRI